MAKRRSMLYLGSFCSIGLFGLTFVRFASALFGSSVLGFQLELYFGLILFSTYVLVDTQVRSLFEESVRLWFCVDDG